MNGRQAAQRLLRRTTGRELRLYDPALRRLIAQLGVAHVIDVGANVGQFATRVRTEGGFKGRIDSIEPVSSSFAAACDRFASDAEWHGHHVAATAQRQAVTMRLFNQPTLNSLSKTTQAGELVFETFGSFHEVGTEDVEGLPLDDLDLPNLGPTFLKIDTQGHDWDVMSGASGLLQRVVLLSMELSFERLYHSSIPAWESLRRLDEMGFVLADFDYVVRGVHPLQIGEADGLFVRRESGEHVRHMEANKSRTAADGRNS